MRDTKKAIRKASGQRLLADMRQAALLLQGVYGPGDRSLPRHTSWARGFVLGAAVKASQTARACLMTAFGA